MSDDLIKRLRFFGPPIQKEAADRIEELEKQKAYLEAKLEVLIDTLYKSAEGWDNVIGIGLIPEEHFGSAMVLRDEALEALHRVGVKP